MALPLLLVGPIVRRVDEDLVTVFLAFSEPVHLTLDVFKGGGIDHSHRDEDGALIEPDFTSGLITTTAFGQNLHVVAAVATHIQGRDPLIPNSLYSYDISGTVDTINDIPFDLYSLGLLEDEQEGSRLTNTDGTPFPDGAPLNLALGYQKDQLPTFLTCPTDIEDLVLVQGGCRNTGSNRQDAVGWVDELIENLTGPLGSRPHQLFLTGDQVYADSAHHLILPLMHEIGAELISGTGNPPTETVTLLEPQQPTGDEVEVDHVLTLADFPAYRRGWMCKDQAEFTTGSSSHILGFGEFAAAYCLAWNPSIWRDLPEEADIFVHDEEVPVPPGSPTQPDNPLPPTERYLTPWRHLRVTKGIVRNGEDWHEERTRRYLAWKKGIEAYRHTIPKIRRALANCATYMIHDDHEVTDDWNLSREWMDRTYGKPLGRQVLRNGMSTCAIFQSWGNDPEGWTEAGEVQATFLDNLSQTWTTPDPTTGHLPNPQHQDDLYIALALDPNDGYAQIDGLDDRLVPWHFKATFDTHKMIAIDTRMKRTFKGRYGPPALLGDSVDLQLPAKTNPNDPDILLLLAPQPPLMPALFDQIAQPLGAAVVNVMAAIDDDKKRRRLGRDLVPHERAETGEEKIEGESWGLEEKNLEKLLKNLATYKKVIILSGDVHFSYTMTLDYWKDDDPEPSRIVQLTISPSRHQWAKMVHALMRTSALTNQVAEAAMPAERLAWYDGDDAPNPAGLHPGMKAKRERSPALFPAYGWPPNTQMPTTPDWRWRMNLVVDQRAETERPLPIQLPALPDEANDSMHPLPTDVLAAYQDLAATHQAQAVSTSSHYRRLVFPTAIGVITFSYKEDPGGGPDRLNVKTDIVSSNPTQPIPVAQGQINTVHETELEPTTDTRPELETL